MGVKNFEKQSGILGQQQKLRKAGRLAVLGLGALVLLPIGQASAGQCTAGQNFAPGTSTRQPNWDFLCAGADLLTDDFQRLLNGDVDIDKDFEDVSNKEPVEENILGTLENNYFLKEQEYYTSKNTEKYIKETIGNINKDQNDLRSDISEKAEKISVLEIEAREWKEKQEEAAKRANEYAEFGLNAQGKDEDDALVWQTKANQAIEDKVAAENELKKNAAAIKAIQTNVDKLTVQYKANQNKLAKLQSDLETAQANTAKLDEERAAVRQQITVEQQRLNELRKSQQQSVAGLPPDATFADRMQRLSWWTDGGVTHNDQWSGPTRSRNTTFSGMIGADMPVSDVTTIGFGVGYSHSAVTQDTAFAGTTDTDTLNLLLKLDWEATGNVSFDMSAAYGISSSHRAAAAGYTDDYLVSNIGLGIGVSSFIDLQDDWRVSGRLGWSGSLNTRYASTDSTGVAQGENTNATSQVQLSTKIEKRLPAIDGSVFADGKLSAVLVDESLINATSSPFTLEFGAGMESQVSDAVSFNARGFVGSIGRADQTTFGGTFGLKVSF